MLLKVLNRHSSDEIYVMRLINTFDLDAADETLDFAIYLCNRCKKWTIYIE
ncbi:hypothetical protein [uncultured Clostridium sp.]|uniref:hypothetical protein n=1 Tax=uncultured Clostridium sp. TaxID=59620 RepID=UPI0028E7A142|nr:hypothetical protein [uncultured Clostridium sp.]